MVKKTINEDWTNWVIRQKKRGVSKENIRQILVRENYSQEIIENLLDEKPTSKTNEIVKNNLVNYNSYKYLNDDKIKILNDLPEEVLNNLVVLNKDPLVITIDNYVSDEVCEHFIKMSENKFKRAKVSGDKEGFLSKGRTGSNHWVSHNTDKITQELSEKISKLVDIPLDNAESYQIIHYSETQEYRRHYDGWLLNNSEKSKRMLKRGGQRLLTVLCYLNDVEDGGGTEFPRLNLIVKAKKGRIVIFQNVKDGTNIRHKLSEHAGMPVLSGEKFAFNLWFREKKYK